MWTKNKQEGRKGEKRKGNYVRYGGRTKCFDETPGIKREKETKSREKKCSFRFFVDDWPIRGSGHKVRYLASGWFTGTRALTTAGQVEKAC
jgi:hypothetical protein